MTTEASVMKRLKNPARCIIEEIYGEDFWGGNGGCFGKPPGYSEAIPLTRMVRCGAKRSLERRLCAPITQINKWPLRPGDTSTLIKPSPSRRPINSTRAPLSKL